MIYFLCLAFFLHSVTLVPEINAQVCSYGDLRLVGGSIERQGRLEMCFNNAWGTVCDYFWTNLDARVACRQLGYSTTGATFQSNAYYGEGTGSIVLGNVRCTGNESSLIECRHSPPGTGGANCDQHRDDVGIYCPGDTCTNGTIRLVDGRNYSQGRLEICFNNVWGTVCHDSWTNLNNKVVCRQLGFSAAVGRHSFTTVFGAGTGDIFLDDVICVGSETSLVQCQHNPVGDNDCVHSEDISILSCEGTIPIRPTNTCTTNSIRLTGGLTNNDGLLELCYNNEWGTVCDNGWTNANAQVACRQLGYSTTGATFSSDISYGSTPTGIFLSSTTCDGSETQLVACRHSGIGTNSGQCTHRNDVTVSCADTCSYGSLRLVGGSSNNEGRLEICINNVWGSVCDSNWTSSNSLVACRTLDFSTQGDDSYRVSTVNYGQGNGVIFLNNVQCTGTEDTLLQCTYPTIGSIYRGCTGANIGLVCSASIVVAPSIVMGIIMIFVLYLVN